MSPSSAAAVNCARLEFSFVSNDKSCQSSNFAPPSLHFFFQAMFIKLHYYPRIRWCAQSLSKTDFWIISSILPLPLLSLPLPGVINFSVANKVKRQFVLMKNALLVTVRRPRRADCFFSSSAIPAGLLNYFRSEVFNKKCAVRKFEMRFGQESIVERHAISESRN